MVMPARVLRSLECVSMCRGSLYRVLRVAWAIKLSMKGLTLKSCFAIRPLAT